MSDWVELDVLSVEGETEKAFYVVAEGGEEFWLPKSQIDDAEGYAKGDENVSMRITRWIAGEKGLVGGV